MEILKEFVVTLVSTLVLITAVEIILPDNSMKKYSKFILGAMLIGVILNPIIKFFSNGEENIENTIKQYSSVNFQQTQKEQNNKEIQKQSFKENISKNINNILKNEFTDMEFSNDIKCTVDLENMNVDIEELIVYVKKSSKGKIKTIEKIKEVTIGNKEEPKKEVKDSKEYEEIKKFLVKELKIEKEKIKIIEKEE